VRLEKISVSAETLESLSTLLRASHGVDEAVEEVDRIIDGGINDANHRVAITVSGRRFGIKTQNRGGPDGEKKEQAFSRACAWLDIPACRAVIVERVPRLDGFDKTPCVITEWAPNSKRLDEVSEEDKHGIASVPDVLLQIGRCVATHLHLGLPDRALKNWVWSHTHQRLNAVDTESSFQGATVQDHHAIIDKFYGRTKLKQERGQSDAAKAFESGLREVHEKFVAHSEAITQAVTDIASAQNYASPFRSLTADQLVEKVFSEL
jgi:hypothetical protein